MPLKIWIIRAVVLRIFSILVCYVAYHVNCTPSTNNGMKTVTPQRFIQKSMIVTKLQSWSESVFQRKIIEGTHFGTSISYNIALISLWLWENKKKYVLLVMTGLNEIKKHEDKLLNCTDWLIIFQTSCVNVHLHGHKLLCKKVFLIGEMFWII